ncbi:hypothetical protein WICPIJ_000688 [Wickerhamomyces pijperi]|uniref:Uncharacterized protein n=1 Tax=Wickerhamomyces pijperi TaxID=599730 RepID=A0A9P8TQL8_WICPI|nr:hypothetical protein WICPIJ_000688 [Wickerhamomyces pijperi]
MTMTADRDVGLNGELGDKSVDVDITCLPNTMTTILALLVHSRVPIRVVEDNSIGTGQIDTQTTGSGRQDKHLDLWIRVESFCEDLTIFDLRGPIQSHVSDPHDVQETFQDVQDFSHLGEDQSTMPVNLQVHEQFRQLLQLTRVVE